MSNNSFCVAREAPYGNDFSAPFNVKVVYGRLKYCDADHRKDTMKGDMTFSSLQLKPVSMLEKDVLSSHGEDKHLDAVNLDYPKVDSDNISEDEKTKILVDFLNVARFVDSERLQIIESELKDYDPYASGLVDLSTVQAICLKHLKQLAIPVTTYHALFRAFARDKRMRQISYIRMLEYLRNLLNYKGTSLSVPVPREKQQQCSPKDNQAKGLTMAQSPEYERGDARILHDLQISLACVENISTFDADRLYQLFNVADRLHLGTLDRNQVEAVLHSCELLYALRDVLPSLLQRADRMSDQRYDWSVIARFIEKSLPPTVQTKGNRPTTIGQHRRDTDSTINIAESSRITYDTCDSAAGGTANGNVTLQSSTAQSSSSKNGAKNEYSLEESVCSSGYANGKNNSALDSSLMFSSALADFTSGPHPHVQRNSLKLNTSTPIAAKSSHQTQTTTQSDRYSLAVVGAANSKPMVNDRNMDLMSQFNTAPLRFNNNAKDELDVIDRQMSLLQLQRDQLREKLESQPHFTNARISAIMGAMNRSDINRTGWLPIPRARQIISTYGEISGAEFDRRVVEMALALAADDSERLVCIDKLQQALQRL